MAVLKNSDDSAWSHAPSDNDAVAVVLPQPLLTKKVKVTLGARAAMEVEFVELRGCLFEGESKLNEEITTTNHHPHKILQQSHY